MSYVPFNDRYPSKEQITYNGITCSGFLTTKETLEKIPYFKVQKDDVCLVTYPRTGTRWTSEILSWIIRDGDEEKMKAESNFDRCPYLSMGLPGNPQIVNAPSAFSFTDRPRLYTTHLPFNMAPQQLAHKGKIVCILRNPKDCAVSFYHFYRMSHIMGAYEGPWSDFLEGFSRGEVEYGSYFKFVTGWWSRRHQENILFVRYEEMKKTPGEHVKKMAEFLGKSLSQSTIDLIVEKTSFKSMQNNPDTNVSREQIRKEGFIKSFLRDKQEVGVEMVRKGEVGDWKNYFTVAQNEAFDELIAEKLGDTGLVFEY